MWLTTRTYGLKVGALHDDEREGERDLVMHGELSSDGGDFVAVRQNDGVAILFRGLHSSSLILMSRRMEGRMKAAGDLSVHIGSGTANTLTRTTTAALATRVGHATNVGSRHSSAHEALIAASS